MRPPTAGREPLTDPNGGVPTPEQIADVDEDGLVTLDDAALVLAAVGTQDPEKEQTGDCWVWVDDVVAVMELVEQEL